MCENVCNHKNLTVFVTRVKAGFDCGFLRVHFEIPLNFPAACDYDKKLVVTNNSFRLDTSHKGVIHLVFIIFSSIVWPTMKNPTDLKHSAFCIPFRLPADLQLENPHENAKRQE